MRAGIEQQLLVLEVQERATGSALTAAANQYTQALNRSVAAMEGALDRFATEIGKFPRGDPNIARIERELPQLRTLFTEVHQAVAGVVDLTQPLVFDLNEVQGVRPSARTEMTQFFSEEESLLRPAAEGLENEKIDPDLQQTSDLCMLAVYEKYAISAVAALLKIYFGSVNRFLAVKLISGAGGSALEVVRRAFHGANAQRSAPPAHIPVQQYSHSPSLHLCRYALLYQRTRKTPRLDHQCHRWRDQHSTR